MKVKIMHLGLTRIDPRRAQKGRVAASRAPRKTPIIGNLHFKEGSAKWVGPAFYVRYKAQLQQYIDLGIIRVEIPPARRAEWEALCSACEPVSPAEQIRLAAVKAQQKALEEEKALREKLEAEEAKRKAEARKKAIEKEKASGPTMSGAKEEVMSGALSLLSDVPPVKMTEEQVSALKKRQTKPKAEPEPKEEKPVEAPAEPVAEEKPAEEKPAPRRRRRARRTTKTTKSE